jgi:hypothetical protein
LGNVVAATAIAAGPATIGRPVAAVPAGQLALRVADNCAEARAENAARTVIVRCTDG